MKENLQKSMYIVCYDLSVLFLLYAYMNLTVVTHNMGNNTLCDSKNNLSKKYVINTPNTCIIDKKNSLSQATTVHGGEYKSIS